MTEAEIKQLEAELSDEEREMLDTFAAEMSRRKLTPAMLFLLESNRPLSFVISQVMVFFEPMIQIVWKNPKRWTRMQSILAKRGSIELLLRRMEAQS